MTGRRCAARSSNRHVPTRHDVDEVEAGRIGWAVSGVAVGASLAVGLAMPVGVHVGGKVGREMGREVEVAFDDKEMSAGWVLNE